LKVNCASFSLTVDIATSSSFSVLYMEQKGLQQQKQQKQHLCVSIAGWPAVPPPVNQRYRACGCLHDMYSNTVRLRKLLPHQLLASRLHLMLPWGADTLRPTP
jgi:hypothetical protein